MDWKRGWEMSWGRWEEIAAAVRNRDAAAVRRALDQECGLCLAAQADIDRLGIPKVEMHRCDFCRGFLDHGGCEEPLAAIRTALDAGNWPAVAAVVGKVQDILRRMAA